jgi:hypothetical protein
MTETSMSTYPEVQPEAGAQPAPTVPDVRATSPSVPLITRGSRTALCDRCRRRYARSRWNQRFCRDACRVAACIARHRYDRPKSSEPPRRARLAQMVADLNESEQALAALS